MVRLGLYNHTLPSLEIFRGEHLIGPDNAPACGIAAVLILTRESPLEGGGFDIVCRACLRRLLANAEEPPR